MFCVAAVRQQFSTVTEENINLKIASFLAQSVDRDGGRKERELKKQQTINNVPDERDDIDTVSNIPSNT